MTNSIPGLILVAIIIVVIAVLWNKLRTRKITHIIPDEEETILPKSGLVVPMPKASNLPDGPLVDPIEQEIEQPEPSNVVTGIFKRKLTDDEIRAIRSHANPDVVLLSMQYDCSVSTISRIIKRQTYKDVI